MKAFLRRGIFFSGSLFGLFLFSISSHLVFAAELPTAGIYDSTHAEAVFAMINGAKESIDIEIYEMADIRFIDAIRTAMNSRGVKVRIIQEPKPVGGKCNVFEYPATRGAGGCENQVKLVQDVIRAGGSYIPFNKKELCANPAKACYLHGKLIIADSKVALVSDGNFNSTNLCDLAENPSRCDRDYSVVTQDAEVVSFLKQVVENDLRAQRYDLNSLFTDSLRKKVTVSPLSLKPITDFINSAQESIDIENQYLKEPTMNQALKTAASSRSVKVNATVSSLCAFGHPSSSTMASSTKLFQAFDAAGINTRMFTAKIKIGNRPGYMHAKAIVVDGSRAWVGSVNGSTAALTNNREFGLFVDNAEMIKSSLLPIIQSDHTDSNGETWQQSLNCEKDYALVGPEPDPGPDDVNH